MGVRLSNSRHAHLICDMCGVGAPSGQGMHGSPFVWPDESPTLWRANYGGQTVWVCERCREELRDEHRGTRAQRE